MKNDILDDRGYCIMAINTAKVDYVACARALAKSIRWFQPNSKICLITDSIVVDDCFDYVRLLPNGNLYPNNPMSNDWQIFYASPFRQTIKLEADLVLTSDIDHWWLMMQHRDVYICNQVLTYQGSEVTDRRYRKHFDLNRYPNCYNAITYWRYSAEAMKFASTLRNLIDHWDQVRTLIKGWHLEYPDLDTIYAMAAKWLGQEKFYIPNQTYPAMVHMKPKLQNCVGDDWTQEIVYELDDQGLRLNTFRQRYPVHYYHKAFANVLEQHYDKLLASR